MHLPTVLAAAALTLLALAFFWFLRHPKTRPGDAVLLELGLGLAGTSASAVWLCVLMDVAS